MKKIILVSSNMQMGKDTCANYLATKLDGYTRSSFSFGVKKIFCDAFGVNFDFIEKWKTNPSPPPNMNSPVRKMLQMIGDGFREFGRETVWTDKCFDVEQNLIISDGRYFSELNAVKDRGGINILIYRPGFENNDTNRSEQELKPLIKAFLDTNQEGVVKGVDHPMANKIDLFINNNGNLQEYYDKIDKIVVPYIKVRFDGKVL